MDEKYENEIKYYIIKNEFLKIHNILFKDLCISISV